MRLLDLFDRYLGPVSRYGLCELFPPGGLVLARIWECRVVVE
jgi:hypothetical protein